MSCVCAEIDVDCIVRPPESGCTDSGVRSVTDWLMQCRIAAPQRADQGAALNQCACLLPCVGHSCLQHEFWVCSLAAGLKELPVFV
jgi:hypothetical protein